MEEKQAWPEEIKQKFSYVYKEIVILRWYYVLYRQMNEIFRANKEFAQFVTFIPDWLDSACLNDLIIKTYRLLDGRRDVDSLVNFLKKLKTEPTTKTYTNLTSEIDGDITSLTTSENYEEITKIRHNYIAHLGKERDENTLIKLDVINNLIMQMANVIEKYSTQLFDTTYITNLVPMGRPLDIFTIPWIEQANIDAFTKKLEEKIRENL